MAVTDDESIERILRYVEKRSGVVFTCYKRPHMRRRISSRMLKLGIKSYDEYYRYILKNRGEVDNLLDALTVNVSYFFRDPDVYQYFGENVLPRLFNRPIIRILSAGCATGEEPYSVAMMCHRYMEEKGVRVYVRVYGYDIDRRSLEIARAGEYPRDSIGQMPVGYRKYFEIHGERVVIRDDIKKLVRFVRKDMLKDDLGYVFDAIFFRNVMIYFQKELQEAFLQKLSEHLRKGGYLILGKTESLYSMNVKDHFRAVDIRTRIFLKI